MPGCAPCARLGQSGVALALHIAAAPSLGAAYGVGTATARDIVRGRSRLASGGPIDD